MISVSGSAVAHLGGPRGDRLSVAEGGGPFRAVADLGWDFPSQCAPQRRILLAGATLFVLEPVNGLKLLPPLRVRRFDVASGREEKGVEGAGEAGEAGLVFHASIVDARRMRILRCGLDPRTGRPLAEESILPRGGFLRIEETCSGVPLRCGPDWWLPFRVEGLLRTGPGGEEFFPGDVAAGIRRGDSALIPGIRRARSGVFQDGRFRPFPGRPPRLFAAYRSPLSGALAPFRGGVVALLAGGGELPALDTPSPRLFPGHYTAIAAIEGRLHGVAEDPWPRLVPAAFDTGDGDG